ncbi:helix-turn-helix domain-containing protein [Streptomyces sp. SID4919]|uniref:AraC family transcriptional regulator n=1 Tax=unclassified Streptomyces TaxID=2593676 RepID=UPI000C0845D5|nr:MULTISPECIES: AraC family transcriptional regulator [unclassified Streptomyces]MYY12100.1 helix-turn-helix domain-containing protein [Streptomyces sp. SID4919]
MSSAAEPPTVAVPLDTPPRVASLGTGVHGTHTTTDVFRLPDLWQLHLYTYSAELVVGGLSHTIRPGRVSLVPPGTEVRYRYRGRSEHLFVHFALPGTGGSTRVPLLQDAGAETPALTGLLRQAVAIAPRNPVRAAAEVWTALWRVAELGVPGGSAQAPGPVAAAIAHVEAHLAGPLAVPDLARVAGVSHNHLTRLFRAETGRTVVAYVRARRMARARHLLRESTLTVRAVADAVGIADLQAFNKACRREFGASPRALRAAARAPGGDQRSPVP